MNGETPPPWRFDRDAREVRSGDPVMGARVCTVHGVDRVYETNGTLLAAAPDLLEALAQALDLIEETRDEELSRGSPENAAFWAEDGRGGATIRRAHAALLAAGVVER